MENLNGNPNHFPNIIQNYMCLSEFRKPLFTKIIKSLNLSKGSKGLDAGCGIGQYTKMLAESIGLDGNVIGLDISKDFINFANKIVIQNVQFEEGDINSLRYKDEYFDWIWSADTVWPGPKELGCPTEDPINIIKEFYRVLKSGGLLILLFWSSYKLLTGYPLLESRLNSTSGATAPFTQGMNPKKHIMNAKYWLEKLGFKDVSAKSFIADINSPLNENTRNALNYFFQMLWGEAENQVSKEDWNEFKRLCNPTSESNVLNNRYYYGFYAYSIFRGFK